MYKGIKVFNDEGIISSLSSQVTYFIVSLWYMWCFKNMFANLHLLFKVPGHITAFMKAPLLTTIILSAARHRYAVCLILQMADVICPPLSISTYCRKLVIGRLSC